MFEVEGGLTIRQVKLKYLQLDNFCIIFGGLQTICISDLGDSDRIFP